VFTQQRLRFQHHLSFLALLALLMASQAGAQQSRVDGVPVMQAQPVDGQAQPVDAQAKPAVEAPTPEPVVYTSSESLDDKRKMAIGDHVSYRVLEDKNPAVDLLVTDDGQIEVPLLGRVSAAGKSCRELAMEVKPVLERTYFYKATVILALDLATQKSPGRIYVSGNVASPGPQEIPPDEIYTLSKAITRAGGISQFGNDHRVKIVRRQADGATQDVEYDVGDIINKGHIEKDPVLEPNDLIVVPRKLINF
jgi:polysaccharide export outer membrane protein